MKTFQYQTEWPDGATRVACDTHWASRADGYPDVCPTEGGRARQRAHGCPMKSGSGPTEGGMGARRTAGLGGWPNGGSRGWPDEGLYKCCWPTFLGTLLQRPVSPARNASVQVLMSESVL
jgi:hypothetical protein